MSRIIKILSVVVVLVVAVAVAGVAVLSSMDFNEYKGVIAEKVSETTGRDLKIAGDLNLEISLNPSIAVDGVTFANAPWASEGDMVSIKRFAAEVSLMPLIGGTIDIKRVILEGVSVNAETDKSGRGNWVFDSKTEEKKETGDSGDDAVLPVVRMVSVKDVTISYKDGVTGQTYDLVVDVVDVQADGADAPLMVNIAGSVNGQQFKVGGTAGTINAMLSGGMLPLDLEVVAMATSIKARGQAGTPDGKPSADLRVGLSAPKLSDTLAAASTLAPALKDVALPPVDALNVDANVKLSGDKLSLSGMSLKFGATDLAGDVSIGLGGAVPSITGKLTSNLINLDELSPKSDGSEASAPGQADSGDGRVFPNDPLPLDGLKAANVDLNFAGEKIVVQGMEITDISVDLSLQNGKLNVKPAATVFAGKITGDIGLDGAVQTPALNAKLNVDQLDYEQALASQGLKDIAKGKVDVNVDVSGKGGSVRALMAGLNGKTRIVTEDGRLESGALNIVSTDLLNVLDSKEDKTIRCGVIHFDIKSGMANARAIVIETGGFSVIGTGDVNLKTEQPKLRIDPRAKKTNIATMAMVPVTIHGTLAKPDWTIDAAAAAGNVAAGAARTGAAIATMGLSLLVEKAVGAAAGAAIDENDYCVPALAGKKVVPGAVKSADAPQKDSGGTAPQPAQKQESDNPLESIGSGLKGLFGN